MILRISNDYYTKQGIVIVTIIALIIVSAITFAFVKIREKYYVHQLFSAYSLITEAYDTALKKETFEWEYGKTSSNIFASKYIKYLPVKTDCKKNDNSCFSPYINYRQPLGPTKIADMKAFHKTSLKNGMSIAIGIQFPTCTSPRNRCGSIFVDLNGSKKGPNKLGTDIFDFGIYKDGIKPYDIEIVHINRCLEGNGQGCASYILKYGNMNYKAYDKIVTKQINEQAVFGENNKK